jgi:hypothetical protein
MSFAAHSVIIKNLSLWIDSNHIVLNYKEEHNVYYYVYYYIVPLCFLLFLFLQTPILS